MALVLCVSTESVPSVIQIAGWLSSNTHTHTQTQHPVSPAESFFPESPSSPLQRSLSFSGSTRISLHSIIAVPHLTASEPPSLISASQKHWTVLYTVLLPLPHLPHSICLTQSRSLSLKIKRYIDKKRRKKKKPGLDTEPLFTLDLGGELGPFAPDWTFIPSNWPR